jgi:hypothetical protein
MFSCTAASNMRALSSSTHSPTSDGLTLKHFIANSGKHKHKQAPLQQSEDKAPVQVDGSLPEDRFASHMADRKFFIETYGCQVVRLRSLSYWNSHRLLSQRADNNIR